MKKQVLKVCLLLISLSLAACNSGQENKEPEHQRIHRQLATNDSFSIFIPVDTANKMLSSYLSSINYEQNDTNLESLSIDVRQLRRYIDSMPNSNQITNIKLMFAHTLTYANSSRANTNAGYSTGGLTIIIAAYDSSGNYIYYTGSKVLDYSEPCPPYCPPGNAANPLLSTNSARP